MLKSVAAEPLFSCAMHYNQQASACHCCKSAASQAIQERIRTIAR
jgi:hypothetical protein